MFFNKKILIILLCFTLISCQGKNNETETENKSNVNKEVEQGLVLYDATLEQSNADGQILWRLSTEKVIYTQDKKIAKLDNITGNLFENGKIILQVNAKKGEIRNDGKEIYLQEEILAVDIRNKAELKGSYIEWKPEEHYLVIQDNLQASHPKLVVTAKQAKYNTKSQILELNGDIFANSKNPQLQLKTEHLYWKISQDKIIGDRPLFFTRYEDKIITDKLKTEQAEIDLNINTATAKGNIEYQSLDPPLQVATDKIIWDYQGRIAKANQPIQVIQLEDQMTLTANLALVNLGQKEVHLEGGIYGEAVNNEVKIYADNLIWYLEPKEINANGNVFYQQINPDFNLKGTRAVGKLQEKQIIITGDEQNKVTTIIYPDE